jgi:uncharacterized MAPEG superfamily protein
MPIEFYVLTLLMMLAASLWIPYIVGVNTAPAGSLGEHNPADFTRPISPAVHRPWVHRAYRAHMNLLEQGIPFALLVFLVDRVGGFTMVTQVTALVFLGLRLTHAVGMITGWVGFPMRPVVFTAGWICCLVMAGAVFTA